MDWLTLKSKRYFLKAGWSRSSNSVIMSKKDKTQKTATTSHFIAWYHKNFTPKKHNTKIPITYFSQSLLWDSFKGAKWLALLPTGSTISLLTVTSPCYLSPTIKTFLSQFSPLSLGLQILSAVSSKEALMVKILDLTSCVYHLPAVWTLKVTSFLCLITWSVKWEQ